MGKRPAQHQQSRNRHPVLLALVCILVIAAAVVVLGRVRSAGVAAEDLTRVLLVAAAPDENGDVVAQIVAVLDLTASPDSLTPISPATPATIPGTSYSTIGDAYPFGGGGAVAAAFARAEKSDPLPYVAVGPDTLAGLLADMEPVRLTLPAGMSVFDGERLYTFGRGATSVDASELAAVFKGAPYLSASERAALDAELSEMLADALAGASPEALATDLSPEALERLQGALAGR